MITTSRLRRYTLGAAVLLSVATFTFGPWGAKHGSSLTWPNLDHQSAGQAGVLECQRLSGADDTVVVLKTGATELEVKLPVRINTTLRCYRHRLIFSDTAAVFHGEQIIDALESVSSSVKDEHPDFELYRLARDQDRSVVPSEVVPGRVTSFDNPAAGQQETPGWKLDKWKFLPMINRTFHEFPDKKWYVFIEADTHILWASLLAHLATLDHRIPHYAGSPSMLDGITFAHGGSGFFVSQPAMRLVTDHYAEHQTDIEAFTDEHWAGDCVLGKAFADSGARLESAWPIWQGDYPGLVPYLGSDGREMLAFQGRIWCSPAVSYHHVEPAMVEDLWNFEQGLLSRKNKAGILHHGDVFRQYIVPRMVKPRVDWDNESEVEAGHAVSLAECHTTCEAAPGCVQYSLRSDGGCRMSGFPRLGKSAAGVQSGWMTERIAGVVSGLKPCWVHAASDMWSNMHL